VHPPGIEPTFSHRPASSLIQALRCVDHRPYEACHFILCDPDIFPILITEYELAQN
jgi:hypothetical protein